MAMPMPNETAPSGIRLLVDGGGRRVLLFGHERIELPGVHPGGPVPEPRVAEDQDGRRVLLLGREQIPIPEGGGGAPAGPSAAALEALPGHPARVEVDETGRTHVCFAGQRIPILPLPLTAQEADSARVLVDDSGRRILIAGGERVVLPAGGAVPGQENRGDPAMVLDDGDGSVLLHAGEVVPLPGVKLTAEESAAARVFTEADGSRFLAAGDRRIPVFSTGGALTAPPAAARETAAPAEASAAPAPARTDVARAPVPVAPPRDDFSAPRPIADGGDDAQPRLNLRSEELQDIIGFVPHWLVRWGTTLVFLTVAVLFAVGWLVRYPDVVRGEAVLTTPVPPVRLVPRSSGEVAHLFVRDGEPVQPGDPLVVLRSAARWEHVFDLAARLETFEAELGDDAAVRAAAFDPTLSLGDLHPAYASLLQALSDYRSSSTGGYDARQAAELERQIADQQLARDAAVAKQRVLADQVALARREHERARAMLARELISQADVDHAEAEYLQRRSTLQDGESALASLDVQLSATRARVLDLRREVDDEGRNQGLALRAAVGTLRGALSRWDQDHVLRAPSTGSVSLFRVVGEHQFVEEGAPLLAILPAAGRPVGRVFLASAGAGKVEAGQRVILRLESFPSREFGAVLGKVARVSQLPMESGSDGDMQYLVEVSVPPELVTTHRRRLPFRQEMRAEAEIVTRDRRLISRLFDQMRGSRNEAEDEAGDP
ncbi:MAG TPA: HlyD family efflux transporter periplasmic adaptor subunit [Longimicrobium sp.]|nr:HlyD family efflux transporter periplasmic adaptor subunit [Longimicrobium sp.]